jgi:hypothetical protein
MAQTRRREHQGGKSSAHALVLCGEDVNKHAREWGEGRSLGRGLTPALDQHDQHRV